ncbi:detoxification [Pseudomonas sp. FW306-02-F02-AA]|uniref:Detoxification n=1 Tax=Pseudomonas fluorescens TaxID=294 RepID=A0A0N9WFJ3_PSEFL|nr:MULTISPECIES: colicin E3/pyocin S6 family cytotoxin [Pseudomonas]ALI01747.1 detoxification [Pseudomonas fluorescens]PMZ05224.1 detoxification [Pseudomonas sp. FW306-02-F02-AB]PMZ08631.1 detoxification [Pseudomonas sp. FW306-02-H06C]PMZ14549.1 detoxification [Pseudomonas sp. FW306-02-F02-AA]PMZ19901.1 detoxification [Pseudomonas sp. FW306-02-F08-AA]
MPERSYPLTYKEQLRRRILQPPPSPNLYPPIADLPVNRPADPAPNKPLGCVFAKSCKLPDGIINYANPSGFVPLDSLKDYGNFALLGGRKTDSPGAVQLKKISGSALPIGLGGLALGGSSVSDITAVGGTVAARLLTGLVALFWPSELGDSALYSEEQLRSLEHANSRVRLRIEQQPDGTLKGYGFYTGNNAEWQRIPVIQFQTREARQVAVFGEGLELIWTPAIDPADTLGIPALEAAPQAPNIWVYPPTEASNSILVNPIYPPEYQDFILVFPADSGVRPLYVVVSVRPGDHQYHQKPTFLPAFPDAVRAPPKTPIRGGGRLRPRWKEPHSYIYEWDFERGKVEKYTKRGKHLGEFDPITGERTKDADPKRWIEP